MRKLFGTDGIRGAAGSAPLDLDTVSRVGAALVATLRAGGIHEPRVVLGCDTRESCTEIVHGLAGGIVSAGGAAGFAGVIPTPGVAFLTRAFRAHAGVVVSASHNPWRDNGIKIFSGEGRKLPDATELALEAAIEIAAPAYAIEIPPTRGLLEHYVSHLVSTLPHRLDGLHVVIDAANGAAFESAPRAFIQAGARVTLLAAEPDGRNINENCGALHPERMRAAVVAAKADLGLALDGDADRIVAADGNGRLLDGDDILFLWTLELLREGKKPEFVVGTVMSNFGLESALRDRGIALLRAAVGDRYVVEEMNRTGAVLGGEPSGHLIRSDLGATGDGTLAGLHVAALVAGTGTPLAAQERIVHTPQILVNIKVREKVAFESIPALTTSRELAEERLAGDGRILLRYSGTESLARVMVEGKDGTVVREVAEDMAGAIRRAIGVDA